MVESEVTFHFEYVDDPQFKNISSNESEEFLTKWGIWQNSTFQKYRYDNLFSHLQIDLFLKDFLNDPMVRKSCPPLREIASEDIKKINFTELKTNAMNMSYFDKFKEANIITDQNYIKKTYEEYHEGIQIADLLKQALLIEESENYDLYTEDEKKEFLFHVFKRLAIGGSVCQYEDYATDYLELTKRIYKDLLWYEM
eukprot:CAMPEP_0114981610 /NCGR_PEP_ID=MMETSP0216-20121206/5636_1 /TAXON_ID=223996 /ORGANISM="Protocruzia adherens, Strain Boccale" /LENGTH=196 /DNA_ID=CAMNT_0002343293 /DNA_START=51 /DNA_END=641 /DNA_ORIENTATION=+